MIVFFIPSGFPSGVAAARAGDRHGAAREQPQQRAAVQRVRRDDAVLRRGAAATAAAAAAAELAVHDDVGPHRGRACAHRIAGAWGGSATHVSPRSSLALSPSLIPSLAVCPGGEGGGLWKLLTGTVEQDMVTGPAYPNRSTDEVSYDFVRHCGDKDDKGGSGQSGKGSGVFLEVGQP